MIGWILLAACGTLHGEGAGDRNLPAAALGPFRALDEAEVDQEPYVSPTRTVAGRAVVVPLADGTFALYRGDEEGGARSIVRETSSDGIAFADPTPVLADATAPSVVVEDGRFRLWYEADGAIALAESDDRTTFAPVGTVLEPGADWEGGRVGAPSVVPDADGGWLLYYEAAGGIGVASSPDGTRFIRASEVPVLAAQPPGEWDDRAVGSPAARVHVSSIGRRTIQLFYVGVAAAPAGEDPTFGVGVAASFDGRAFERSTGGPVLERARALLGLGPPVSIGPADLLPFTEARSSGTGVGGAVWPAEVRFDRPE